MWKIESIEITNGGLIYEGDKVRIKNMKNNMYIMVKDTQEE